MNETEFDFDFGNEITRAPITTIVALHKHKLCIKSSKRVGNAYEDEYTEFSNPFVMDMPNTTAGWVLWEKGGSRQYHSASVMSKDKAVKPVAVAGGTPYPVVMVPVAGAEAGHLEITTTDLRDAFKIVWNEYIKSPQRTSGQIPMVEFFGNIGSVTIKIIGWSVRDEGFWGSVI